MTLDGFRLSQTDAAGAITTTTYDIVHDKPSVVTDAMGNTSCYKYDLRGRKIAEWGTAIQPACFGYDAMNNMTSLRTFRAESEVITTDPSERTDGDVTTWAFNPVTGLEISKTYADNTTVVKTYDAYNRLATETDARGNIKTHTYEHARGLHLGTTYTVVDDTAETAARSFSYNHLGQLTHLTDDSGIRTFTYNTYGEEESDSLSVDGDTHLVTELRDDFGRSTGYTYSKNGAVQQTVTTGYGDDGRIASAGFLHGGAAKNFGYTYLAGTNLLQVLTKPNGMTLTQTYEATRDLLTGMAYHRGSTLVAQHSYSYDILGRPTARHTARQGRVVSDTFAHNSRSELVDAQVNGKDYEYAYDNIGNRAFTLEDGKASMYEANALNQYTAISENGAAAFVPMFDADGNQTHIKTETGIWSAVYNAENRPVSFTNSESNTVVECAYDSQGRRAYKKVTVNGSVTLHQRYIYRGYLQIAALDLTRTAHPALWYITWDPSQPVATRPLAIQINGTWYTYGWDLTKNICELYSPSGAISTTYTYTPFGQVTASGSVTQTIQWSSEVYDIETALCYYNFRFYHAEYSNWIIRDLINEQKNNFNLYTLNLNRPIDCIDLQGNLLYGVDGTWASATSKQDENSNVVRFVQHSSETPTEYFRGPYDALGTDSSLLLSEVRCYVCRELCKNPQTKLNFVGWSRGATVILKLADILNRKKCECDNGSDVQPPIEINWIGLFDAVDMIPTSGWNDYIPTNVRNAAHLIKSDRNDNGEHTHKNKRSQFQRIFPTTETWIPEGSSTNFVYAMLVQSNHSDVGSDSDVALNWMLHQAKAAGVNVRVGKKNWKYMPEKK